jgi:hypothetical protein
MSKQNPVSFWSIYAAWEADSDPDVLGHWIGTAKPRR